MTEQSNKPFGTININDVVGLLRTGGVTMVISGADHPQLPGHIKTTGFIVDSATAAEALIAKATITDRPATKKEKRQLPPTGLALDTDQYLRAMEIMLADEAAAEARTARSGTHHARRVAARLDGPQA